MTSAGVFLGGLASVLTCNLMLIGVCSSAPTVPLAAAPPPPLPAPVVRLQPKYAEPPSEPLPWGVFIWGCGGRVAVDLEEGAVQLPICGALSRR